MHPDIQVNVQDNNDTALIEAANQRHSGIVKLLFAHPDIQVNVQDNYGNTALTVAANIGHADIVKFLLDIQTFKLIYKLILEICADIGGSR